MINMTNTQFVIYEVDITSYEWNDTDSEYVVCDRDNQYTFDDIISKCRDHIEYGKVEVYEARTADMNVSMYKSGQLEFEAGEIDTSTGYNGSAIHVVYYDKNGNKCDPYENEDGV